MPTCFLVTFIPIRCSAHAYSTIEENVYWAAERGLQVLGSADHLSSMVTACPNDLRSYQFFINQDIWPRI